MKPLSPAVAALLLAALTACAARPPAPPECEGELVPINAHTAAPTAGENDAARPRS